MLHFKIYHIRYFLSIQEQAHKVFKKDYTKKISKFGFKIYLFQEFILIIICIMKRSVVRYILRVRRAIAARLDLGEESPSSIGQGAG